MQVQVKGTGSLSFIKTGPVTRDICPLLPKGCPINKGLTSITITQEIPSYVPAVSDNYVIQTCDLSVIYQYL